MLTCSTRGWQPRHPCVDLRKMFKKKRIWLVTVVLALTLLLWGCTHLFGPAGLGVNEQGSLQPSSATSAQFEVVNGKVRVLISFVHQPGSSDEALIRGVGGVVHYTYHLIPAIAATIPEAATVRISSLLFSGA